MPRIAALIGVLLTATLAACSGTDAAPPASDGVTAPRDQVDNPVVLENRQPGDGSWRQAMKHAGDMSAMSAYADESSVSPGDDVGLFVSTTAPDWTVQAYRMGWYSGERGRLVWTSDSQPGQEQTAQGFIDTTQTPYAEWKESLRISTQDWVPGMYLLRLVGSNQAEWLVPLVVKSPDVEGRLVFIMSDLTWQSYNEWGGRSAYKGPTGFGDRSRAVSFSRPYAYGYGTGKYLAYEQPVVSLAERLGIPVSYVAASDLAGDPAAFDGAEGIVSLGHNEYWSPAERSSVTAARDRGVDLAFLGANTMYWRVRLEDGPRSMPLQVIYKSADEDPENGPTTTARFRDDPAAESERTLIGMDYECFPATGTYTIADPGFFLFADAHVTKGERFAGLVDTEVDRAYPLPGTPKNLQIVANSPTTCGSASTISDSTYYSRESGAGVFAVGTMGWVLRGLRHDAPAATSRFVRRVTSTLLTQMLAGPMGAAHPSQGNISQFDLGDTNTTGAA